MNLCPGSPTESDSSTQGLSNHFGLLPPLGMKVVKQFSLIPPLGCESKSKEKITKLKSSTFLIGIQVGILEPF